MRKITLLLSLILLSFTLSANDSTTWIRINQAGYLPKDIKVAVYISLKEESSPDFTLYDALTEREVFKGVGKRSKASEWGMKSAFRFDFSSVKREGGYYIISNGVKSPNFKIAADSYEGLADFMLVYMRQQRCGDNPYTGVLCHQDDGFIVDHPTRSGEKIDVRGGWHDATDYLQYLTTSATAVYHLMFAWEQQKDKSL
ncbi:MAG: glycoside hydrolase family 9 protein, partial [Bacteroidales bacterium]|nr:glycoside hydrolase family 9 protein [Bacteroidales bacterium]